MEIPENQITNKDLTPKPQTGGGPPQSDTERVAKRAKSCIVMAERTEGLALRTVTTHPWE